VRAEYKISVITVNYDGLKDTCQLIDCLLASGKDVEIVVVDNASKNDESQELQRRYPTIKVVETGENLGFAGGNNAGIKAATGDYLFFINNDTLFDDFNPEVLVERLESDSKIGMVCPKIRFSWGSRPIQFAGYTRLSPVTVRNRAIGYGEDDHGQYDEAHPTPYAHGAAMMVKREVIEKAGMIPTDYFLYYEELDWSMAIRRAGYGIWYDPRCTIFHKESQSTGKQSGMRTYFITRNRLLLVKRNYPWYTKWLAYLYLLGAVVPRDLIRASRSGDSDQVKAIKKGVNDFFKTK